MTPALDSRRFVAWAARSFLLTLAAVTALNVVVDPYAECGTQLFLPDDNDRNCRPLKVALLRRRQLPPQVLIVGNSRALTLPARLVRERTGLRAFNAAATSATLWDVLAFTRFVSQQPGHDLRVVIAGIDSFMINNDISDPDYELLYFPLVRFLPEVAPPIGQAHAMRAARLASPATAGVSASLLFFRMSATERPRSFVFDPNGTMHYDPYDQWVREDRWPGPLPFALEAVHDQYVRDFQWAPVLSGRTLGVLAGWLREMQQAGVRVILFLPPLHSGLGRRLALESHYRAHLDLARDCLRAAADRFGVPFHDFSSVERFGGDDRWFVDGVHMLDPNGVLLIGALLDDVPVRGPDDAVR